MKMLNNIIEYVKGMTNMKIKETFEKVVKTEKNMDWVDLTEIAQELNVEYYGYSDDSDIKCYWLGNWKCTDTWVGHRCYFLNDEPLAFSIQKARKSNEEFYFVSEEMATKARNYILSLITKEDEMRINIIKDIEEDIRDGYKINFIDQVLDWSKATYNGKKVKIIEKVVEDGHLPCIATKGRFKMENGEIEILDIKDLIFLYNIEE